MKNFRIFLLACCVITSLLAVPKPLPANDLKQIYNSYKSMVHVLAESGGIFKTGEEAVLDPQTGRILVLSNLVGAKQEQKGMGIIVNAAGIIATNLHTVRDASRITVTLHNGKQFLAEVVYINIMKDLCLLRIKADEALNQIDFADSDQIKSDTNVYILGSVQRTDNSLSTGKIVHVEKKDSGSDGNVNSIQIVFDFEIIQGDSGRPVFNEAGKCVGIIAAGTLFSKNQVYAIPSNMITDAYLKFLNSK